MFLFIQVFVLQIISVSFTVDTAEGATTQPPSSRLSSPLTHFTQEHLVVFAVFLWRYFARYQTPLFALSNSTAVLETATGGEGSEFTHLWDVNRKWSVSGFTV